MNGQSEWRFDDRDDASWAYAGGHDDASVGPRALEWGWPAWWAKHDSARYAKNLPAAALNVSPALRRRVAARAKKPVTLRLEARQIAAAKRAADPLSLPYQTLLRMWIAERLAKERSRCLIG